MSAETLSQLSEVASRIKEMREIMGWSVEEMAEKTEVSAEIYKSYESGADDMPFSFIYKCAQVFDIQMTQLLEGKTARLSSYTVTRKGQGQTTVDEDGITIRNLAPKFKDKISEPYMVRYEYSADLQNRPIDLATHSGQEFDLVLEGSLKVQVGEHTEILNEGDSIYYNSSTPHGMIAVGGKACSFCAVVLPGEETKEEVVTKSIANARSTQRLVCEEFVKTTEDENGCLLKIEFPNRERFNFGFDIVDGIAEKYPEKLAMIHVDKNMNERRFTFQDIKRASSQVANYFASLGIKKGDRVMLVLKRHYQFWFSMVALHKLGAIAIPATHQLKDHDFEYRFNAAGVSAIVCTSDDEVYKIVDEAQKKSPTLTTKILVGGVAEGWHDFDAEYGRFSGKFPRPDDAPCGDEAA
ncbi:MAG: AMP-binding protein, partial [Clostridia bacterium]|nr:AMP-binding protein [Clostridia bacterium]